MKRSLRLVGICTLLTSVTTPAFAQSAKPRFEVASVKPTRELIISGPPSPGGTPPLSTTFRRFNTPLAGLVQYAYGMFHSQIVGGPSWFMRTLSRIVANVLEAPVVDETRLTGLWTFRIRFSELPGSAAGTRDDAPAFTAALEQQLGLRATTRRGPRDVLVVESVSRPSPN